MFDFKIVDKVNMIGRNFNCKVFLFSQRTLKAKEWKLALVSISVRLFKAKFLVHDISELIHYISTKKSPIIFNVSE
jgi:hypothetical protein